VQKLETGKKWAIFVFGNNNYTLPQKQLPYWLAGRAPARTHSKNLYSSNHTIYPTCPQTGLDVS
jgi:hypothetical protein